MKFLLCGLFSSLTANSFICMTNSYKARQIGWICMTYVISIYKSSNGDFIFDKLFSVTCVYISVVFELLCPNNS